MIIPWNRVLLFALVSILAVLLGFATFSPKVAIAVFKHIGYGLTLIALFSFVFYLAQTWNIKASWRKLRAGGWKVALVVLALTIFIQNQEQRGFKIVMDEVALVSTSKRMHEHREAAVANRGYSFGTRFVTLNGEADKRPLLFPVLLSLVHDFVGFRIDNAFWLNAALTPIFLLLLYLLCARVSGAAGGVVAILLFSTVPLLAQAATSAGFELLNLTMILTTILIGMEYVLHPSATRLATFTLSGVLLAQCRYESVLFVAPLAAVIMYAWWKKKQVDFPWILMLSPLLLVGYPLQKNIMEVNPAMWQLGDRLSTHGIFSIRYLHDNIGRALNYFLSIDYTMPNSHLVFACGVIGLGFLGLKIHHSCKDIRDSRADIGVFAVFMITLCVVSVLLLCFFWGAFDDVVTRRLSLPVQLLMILAFVWIWPTLVGNSRRWSPIIVICILYLFFWTAPVLQKRAYAHTNISAEGINILHNFIKKDLPDNSFTLDSQSGLLWVTADVPATSLDVLSMRAKEFLFHYDRKTFAHFFLIQRLVLKNPETNEWRAIDHDADFESAVVLSTVKEVLLNPTNRLCILKVQAFDRSKLLAWAEKKEASRKAKKDPSVPHESLSTESKIDEALGNYMGEWLINLP